MTVEPVVVGVDIGGTKVLAGVVDAQGRVLRTARRHTPGRQVAVSVVEDVLDAAVREAAGGMPLAAVGVAAAGFVDAAGDSVLFAPHLPWRGTRVAADLAARWSVPVALDNDANAAAYAEVRFGALRGAGDAVVVTLGTGIGGAVVFDGQVHRGWNGMAGEFGHMKVVPDGRRCECGGRGCWEQYCSGHALARYAGTSSPAAAGTAPADRPADGPAITRAARDGEPTAVAAFAETGRWLGAGLANVVAALDPELVVVGGGLAEAGELLLTPARAALADSLVGAAHRRVPDLVTVRLGPEAGLIGAAARARRLADQV